MHLFSRIANQFWSDPSCMSTYLEATFRPRAARPGEVTLLVPHLWNPGETLPVHIPQSALLKIWMSLMSQMAEGAQVIPPNQPNVNVQATW